MSEIERFSRCEEDGVDYDYRFVSEMRRDPEGSWVRYSDYEKLEAEQASLRDRHDAESERAEQAEAELSERHEEIERLKGTISDLDLALRAAPEIDEAVARANKAEQALAAEMEKLAEEFERRAAVWARDSRDTRRQGDILQAASRLRERAAKLQ